MGEEWRKGWHPEIISEKTSDSHVLVVGAGPAGLESARALGQRGYRVTLAEASRELGGRVSRESRLPGLSEWARVRDYRTGQIQNMSNVEVYLESDLTAEQVREISADHVAIATGARWRNDGFGRAIRSPIPGAESVRILTPDDIINGEYPDGPVVIYDDDHYYMGSVIAELMAAKGLPVTFATSNPRIASWTEYTLEQGHIENRLINAGVKILPRHQLSALEENKIHLFDTLNRETVVLEGSVISVTARLPRDELYSELMADPESLVASGIKTVRRIGDCFGPATIAAAIYEGHRYAREMDSEIDPDGVPFKLVSYELDLEK
ncbi:MAG: FAD-dependent oxidoreductase [Proteobacteria bacterium]|nr:FAD-dependent oxidoreductase [Pseudomonadota bacterium]